MKISKKIMTAFFLCLSIQTTQPVSGSLYASSVQTKAILGLAAAGAGAAYLYKHPEIGNAVSRTWTNFTGRCADTKNYITNSWAWKSKTCLTALGLTVGVSLLSGKLKGDKDVLIRMIPAAALGTWFLFDGIEWMQYKYQEKYIHSQRTAWEKDLYAIELPDGTQLNTLEAWIDKSVDAVDAGIGCYNEFKQLIAGKTASILSPQKRNGSAILAIINKRLKEREKEIQKLEQSTGLIYELTTCMGNDKDKKTLEYLARYCIRKTGAEYNFTGCENELKNLYKDGSDLSRILHIHSFSSLEGFSWNQKITLQWKLIKEYIFLYLIKNLNELPPR
ncbi:hypothetical protein K9K77_03220 [Candidatus Babeliales bacterium]|nr:hypothetical protein [Candidatus Babeliales bacterium]